MFGSDLRKIYEVIITIVLCKMMFSDVSACPTTVAMPELDPLSSCTLMESCTGIECCITTTDVSLTWMLRVLIDKCNKMLYVEIEKLEFSLSIEDYTWGKLKSHVLMINFAEFDCGYIHLI